MMRTLRLLAIAGLVGICLASCRGVIGASTCDPSWTFPAEYQYQIVHRPDESGFPTAFLDYADHVDRLHAECCARATKADQEEWCQQ